AVVDAVQVMAEPLVDHVVGRVAAVSALMEVSGDWKTIGLHLIVDAHAVLGHDGPVVESVRQQYGSLDVLHEWKKISLRPEVVVVTRRAIASAGCCEESVAICGVAVRALCRIAAVDEIVNKIDVLAQPSTRMTNETIGAVVVVVRCIR